MPGIVSSFALVDGSLVGRMGIAGYDPLRIVLDVRGTGRTGYEIADALRPGDYVFIQFGHNDASVEKTDRYTPPADYRRTFRAGPAVA